MVNVAKQLKFVRTARGAKRIPAYAVSGLNDFKVFPLKYFVFINVHAFMFFMFMDCFGLKSSR